MDRIFVATSSASPLPPCPAQPSGRAVSGVRDVQRGGLTGRECSKAEGRCTALVQRQDRTFRGDAVRDEDVHQHPDQGRAGFRIQGSRVQGVGFKV